MGTKATYPIKQLSCILLLCMTLLMGKTSFAHKDLKAPLEAEKFYTEKKYKEAIASYESLLKEGYTSYKLHYNLGNAYYKNKELGKAIYHYELANKLEPNNEDVLTNLRIANEKTIDKIESKENFFLSVIKSGLVNALSTSGWAWLSIISLIVSLGLFFLFFTSQNLVLKRVGFFAGLLCFLLFPASMVLGFSALNDKQNNKFAIITARETRTHEEPSDASGSKFSLHEGTRVRVLETNDEWTNIKLENGNEAWIKTADAGLF
jgi:tetratricopeptide (TPR) repeat protein